MRALRKLVAITLLAIFGLPFAQSLFALTPKSDTNLPACCRRSGKHHCMMSMAERAQSLDNKPRFEAPKDKCPYAPATVAVSHHPTDGVATASVIFAELVSHPSVRAQTESKRRIAQDRSRSKRGPPTLATL